MERGLDPIGGSAMLKVGSLPVGRQGFYEKFVGFAHEVAQNN